MCSSLLTLLRSGLVRLLLPLPLLLLLQVKRSMPLPKLTTPPADFLLSMEAYVAQQAPQQRAAPALAGTVAAAVESGEVAPALAPVKVS